SAAAGQGIAETTADWAAAVLYNGLERYDDAAAAAGRAVAHALDAFMANFALPELVEAAARRRDAQGAADALARPSGAARPAGTDWALGIEARCQALVGEDAEEAYREAVERLGRTALRPDLARARLLYGEWLHERGRRPDAREQLRAAHDMFTEIGMEAF